LLRGAACVWLMGWALFGLPWDGMRPRPEFGRLQVIPFQHTRPADAALNLLYYVPLGAIGVGFGWPAARVVGVAAALSGATESAQLFSRDRFPSTSDVILNVAGAMVGITCVSAVRSLRGAAARARESLPRRSRV
jgi:hypothetical protein